MFNIDAGPIADPRTAEKRALAVLVTLLTKLLLSSSLFGSEGVIIPVEGLSFTSGT